MDFISQIEVCRDDMKLKDICEINPRMQKIDDSTEVSFVSMPSVSEDGKIDTTDIRRYSDVKKGYTSFKENDVLFAKITPCMENGKGAIARGLRNGYGCGSSEFHVLRSNDKAMPEWIYCLTSWQRFREKAEKHMTGSAGQRRVPKQYLENYEIRLPGLKVQAQQVETLMHLRSIIDRRITEVRSFDELIKARFVEMFGDLADPACKWEKCKLVDVCVNSDDIKCGPFGTQLGKDEYTEEGVAVWEIPQINSEFRTLPTHFVTEKKAEELDAYSIIPGDIAMSRKGNVGRCAVFPSSFENGIIHSDVLRIRLNEMKALPEFMMRQLHYSGDIQHQIELVSSGAIMAGINVTKLKQILIYLPPMNLQSEFVKFVAQVDKSEFVERFLELSLFYGLSSPLNSEMICIFPYF